MLYREIKKGMRVRVKSNVEEPFAGRTGVVQHVDASALRLINVQLDEPVMIGYRPIQNAFAFKPEELERVDGEEAIPSMNPKELEEAAREATIPELVAQCEDLTKRIISQAYNIQVILVGREKPDDSIGRRPTPDGLRGSLVETHNALEVTHSILQQILQVL